MKCDVCEQMFDDLPRLMEHRKLHFDYACFCNVCWQGFFDYLELDIHIAVGIHISVGIKALYLVLLAKLLSCVFNQVFNENLVIVMLKSAAGGRACGRQLLVSGQ